MSNVLTSCVCLSSCPHPTHPLPQFPTAAEAWARIAQLEAQNAALYDENMRKVAAALNKANAEDALKENLRNNISQKGITIRDQNTQLEVRGGVALLGLSQAHTSSMHVQQPPSTPAHCLLVQPGWHSVGCSTAVGWGVSGLQDACPAMLCRAEMRATAAHPRIWQQQRQ